MLLVLSLMINTAYAYLSPGAPSGYINDFAGLFSESERTQLEQKVQAFENESTNEISVVTITALQGDTIENFAVQLFEEWGIGKAKSDNGVLLLIAKDERQMRIEVGYGLEPSLTDAIANSIIQRQLIPSFRENRFYDGVNTALDSIIQVTKGEYVATQIQDNESWQAWANTLDLIGDSLSYFFLLAGAIFVFFFISMFLITFNAVHLRYICASSLAVLVYLFSGYFFLGVIILIPLLAIASRLPHLAQVFKNSLKNASSSDSSNTSTSWSDSSSSDSSSSSSDFGGGSSGGGGASGSW